MASPELPPVASPELPPVASPELPPEEPPPQPPPGRGHEAGLWRSWRSRRSRRNDAAMNTNCLDDASVIPIDGRESLTFRFMLDVAVSLSVVLGNGFIVTAIVCFRHRTRHALLRVSHVSNR